MKLILKNLKQVKYIVELESEKSTVKDLKNEIEKLHGFDSSQIKLLYNGKVLEDSKTIEEYQIKEENIIIMMNTKPKAKPSPPPSEQPKQEEQPKKEEQTKQEEQPKKEEEQPKQQEQPKPDYTQQINSLVDMGYEREKVEKAINASKGNVDVAIEYLTSGNIPEVSNNNQPNPPNQPNQENQPSNNKPNLPLELRRNASLMKIVCRDDPEKIYDILNTLEQKNPALLNKIREHQEEFKNLLVSPINQQDIDTYKLLEDDMKGIGRQGGRRSGQVEIRLTPEESEAVKRLSELGDFSQSEILTAYLACDKNEELAANYLFEQRWREEEEEGNNNQGQ